MKIYDSAQSNRKIWNFCIDGKTILNCGWWAMLEVPIPVIC